jgi:hypothetical protein
MSLAASPDGRVAFGAQTWTTWVQDAAGSGGRYEDIPSTYVAVAGDRLVVAGGAGAETGVRFFTSEDGWATLVPAGESPLGLQHLTVDADRVVVTTGTEVHVLGLDRFLAGADADEAELSLVWQLDAPSPWPGLAVATALRGDVLWIAAGDGVRAFDLAVDPPALLYVLADNDPYDVRLVGDALLVAQNETGAKFDVRDPRAPRIAGQILGGDALDGRDAYVVGASSTDITLSRLGEAGERPEPLARADEIACEHVVVLADRALVTCDDQGTFEISLLNP